MATKSSKKATVLGNLVGVFTVLGVIVAILSYMKINPKCNPLTDCEPKFKFTYEGTGKPLYEVAEGLNFSGQTNKAILPFSITVEVEQYSGNQYSGEMDVYVEWIDKDKNKQEKRVGKWDSFRNQNQTPVIVNLFPSDLFRYTSLPATITSYTWENIETIKGTFDLVVRYTDRKELARETVTVVHTPWYHYALLEDTVVAPKTPVTVHVVVSNLGEPSNFKITGYLYDTTEPVVSSITDSQDWWVERTWKNVYSGDLVTDAEIETNINHPINLTIPGEYLLEGRTYALGVTVFKELPYLTFTDTSENWAISGERWRYRDNPIYLSIFVVK